MGSAFAHAKCFRPLWQRRKKKLLLFLSFFESVGVWLSLLFRRLSDVDWTTYAVAVVGIILYLYLLLSTGNCEQERYTNTDSWCLRTAIVFTWTWTSLRCKFLFHIPHRHCLYSIKKILKHHFKFYETKCSSFINIMCFISSHHHGTLYGRTSFRTHHTRWNVTKTKDWKLHSSELKTKIATGRTNEATVARQQRQELRLLLLTNMQAGIVQTWR